MAYRLGELAGRVGGSVRGDEHLEVRGISTLDDAGPSDLSFLTNVRYRAAATASRAGALLVGPGTDVGERTLLVAPNPYLALAELLPLFHPAPERRPGVSPDARLGGDVQLGDEAQVDAFAIVGEGSVLGDRVVIGAGSVVGEGCCIGSDTELRPRVVLYPGTRVGSRCLLHAGVVLGGDGFGFATVAGEHHKIPQVGRVVLEDDVEIGANSTVDRAMLGETRVGRGSKIDDLVMVAHGVRLGAGALLAAQAGIAGSARLGERATLAGQSGVAGHLRIGDSVTVAAKSAVFGDLDDRVFVAGTPAVDHRLWKRSQALLKRLPELKRELRELRTRLESLEGSSHSDDG